MHFHKIKVHGMQCFVVQLGPCYVVCVAAAGGASVGVVVGGGAGVALKRVCVVCMRIVVCCHQ